MSTHHIDVTFQMEEMDGSPDCSAEILFDLYISDLVTVVKSSAYDAKFTLDFLVNSCYSGRRSGGAFRFPWCFCEEP